MLPVIAIVGRPNVGKSTLFNFFTKTRDAIVADLPGVTRDRQYGHGHYEGSDFIVIDTGGIGGDFEGLDHIMEEQASLAIDEADAVIFMVDGRGGLTSADEAIADNLRMLSKTVYLAVNKTDGIDPDIASSEFYGLGFDTLYPMAASHGRGLSKILSSILEHFAAKEAHGETAATDPGIQIAFIGKPNVGKSTLVNRILGEERVLVFDSPGTTRDSIFIPFKRNSDQYTLIDTAGVRRRSRVSEALEKFSVIKTLQAIEACQVAIMVVDARENISEQDQRLLGHIIRAGKAMVVAINKWDGMSHDDKDQVRKEISRRLGFVDFARLHFISAKHGSGVGDLFKSVNEAYRSATRVLTTSRLTEVLEQALFDHQPPLVRGRRIKLRYAHAGGANPPTIIIHGNQTDSLPESYRRYLNNFFRKTFQLIGTPIRLVFKTGDNPFKGRRNKLTPRQEFKKKRMMKFYKKKD